MIDDQSVASLVRGRSGAGVGPLPLSTPVTSRLPDDVRTPVTVVGDDRAAQVDQDVELTVLLRGASRLHTESKPNILVRDIPEDIHAQLRRRAEHAGRSLQAYLAEELARLARRPTIDDILERVEHRSGGRVGIDQAAQDLAGERAGR